MTDRETEGCVMLERLNDYDWEQAFEYADAVPIVGATCAPGRFTREDVAEILAIEDGVHDEESWIGLFRLNDGRFAYLEAGCDYTGWDCQASGSAQVADTMEQLVRFGVGQDSRRRFGKSLPEDAPPDAYERWKGGGE